MTDTALAILKYAYLAVLWGFALSAIALIRRDIFVNKRLSAPGAHPEFAAQNAQTNSAGPGAPLLNSAARPALNERATAATPELTPAEAGYQRNYLPTQVAVIRGIAEGDTFSLGGFELVIGRDNIANIVLADNFVSGKHARIFKSNEKFYIEDLRSTNGTVVGGEKISRVTELKMGSKIQIGNNVLELQ